MAGCWWRSTRQGSRANPHPHERADWAGSHGAQSPTVHRFFCFSSGFRLIPPLRLPPARGAGRVPTAHQPEHLVAPTPATGAIQAAWPSSDDTRPREPVPHAPATAASDTSPPPPPQPTRWRRNGDSCGSRRQPNRRLGSTQGKDGQKSEPVEATNLRLCFHFQAPAGGNP